jgi:ubiquinone/menaquinone biosynthesis C-methylase UbiE
MDLKKKNIQSGYDKIAAEYAQRFLDEQAHKPMDQEMLQRFADEVRGKGVVCDMGCGPGQIAAWLQEHCGLDDLLGVDLSPRFIEEARKLHPQIEFHRGDMLCLDYPDDAWAGVTAFYYLIHIPRERVVEALKEIRRVLKPGGVLLLTFHIGSEVMRVEEFLEQSVDMFCVFFEPEEMEAYLREAGYDGIESFVRKPYSPEVEYQSRRAYIFARKAID